MATPSGQQGSGGSDSGDGDIIAVYEFCAAEYSWGPDYIEAWITDSQLIEYIDRAEERRSQQSQVDLDRLTLGVNTGTLITYDQKAMKRWQLRHRGPQSADEFTNTVNRLAARFPHKIKTH
jgi:hypothetical protein